MSKVIELLNTAGAVQYVLDERECTATVMREVNQRWTITIDYPVPVGPTDGEDKSTCLAYLCQVRIKDVSSSVYDTFVLTRTDEIKDTQGRIHIIATGEHKAIWDLNRYAVAGYFDYANVTPETVLTKILSYVTGWSVGTVEPSTAISVKIGWESATSALQKLIKACDGEFDIDEANAEIDILSEIGSDNSVYIRADHNLEAIRRTHFSRDLVNKIFGVGGGSPPATIAGARHVVSGSVSGTGVITVVGNRVVAENDSWNTNFEAYFVTGAEKGNAFTITDCAHGTSSDTLTIATSRTIAAGDKFIIRTTGHVEVDYIRAGTSIASNGTVEGVYRNVGLSSVVNEVETPALDGTYSGGLCADWTNVGTATVAENTTADYIQYGSKSQHVTASGDGKGISQGVAVTSGRYYTVTAWVYIVSGTVEVQATDGTSTWTVSKSATGWQRFTITEKSAGATLTVKALADGGAAEFYVDAVQVTEGVLNHSFTANADRTQLWHEAFDELMRRKDPPVEYEVSFIDLNRMYPNEYPDSAIALGDTVTVYDNDLGISNIAARVKTINYDVFQPQLTRHIVSNL